jgi:hypothetical protein
MGTPRVGVIATLGTSALRALAEPGGRRSSHGGGGRDHGRGRHGGTRGTEPAGGRQVRRPQSVRRSWQAMRADGSFGVMIGARAGFPVGRDNIIVS